MRGGTPGAVAVSGWLICCVQEKICKTELWAPHATTAPLRTSCQTSAKVTWHFVSEHGVDPWTLGWSNVGGAPRDSDGMHQLAATGTSGGGASLGSSNLPSGIAWLWGGSH